MKMLLLILLTILIVSTKAEEIPIGVLVDLSGSISMYGTDIKNTLEIAEKDVIKSYNKNYWSFSPQPKVIIVNDPIEIEAPSKIGVKDL